MIYISNAFSLQMLVAGASASATRTSLGEVQRVCVVHHGPEADVAGFVSPGDEFVSWKELGAGVTSVFGHPDIARIAGNELDCSIPVHRVSITLAPADTLYVCQYVGSRLPEGATVLPEGAHVEWFKITVTAADPVAVISSLKEELSATKWLVADSKAKDAGLPADVGRAFLADENVRYEGYPDDEGRNALAKEHGLTREVIDKLLDALAVT